MRHIIVDCISVKILAVPPYCIYLDRGSTLPNPLTSCLLKCALANKMWVAVTYVNSEQNH